MASDTPVIVATGKWYSLGAIFKDQQYEFEAWQQITETDGGLACPFCGEPLLPGPAAAAGTTSFYCRYAGDHKFHAPGDVVRPQRGVKMGRGG